MYPLSILRIAGLNYQTPMAEIILKNPNFLKLTYDAQQKIIFDNYYVYSDSFSKSMRLIGHQCSEIIYDFEILQKNWAREQKVLFNCDQWQADILIQQIAYYKPDVLFFQDVGPIPQNIRARLKERFPFIKIVAMHKGYPHPPSLVKDFDIIFAGYPDLEKLYKNTGMRVELLYHGFDDSILTKLQKKPAPYDFTFVGSSGYAQGLAHAQRYWMLVDLLQKSPLLTWIEDEAGPKNPNAGHISHQTVTKIISLVNQLDGKTLQKMRRMNLIKNYRFGKRIDKVLDNLIKSKQVEMGSHMTETYPRPDSPLRKKFPQKCNPARYGIDMYNVLYNSKITFHCSTNAAPGQAGAMRLFQATGTGACLLTNNGDNMPDLFIDNKEIVTYSSIEDCISKVRYLLENDDVRKKIAAAGQKRTLKDHTIMNRCKKVDQVLQECIKN